MCSNADLTRLVVSDKVLQAEVRLAGAEVGGQKREERCDALVDALVRLLGLQVSQGSLRLFAEQRPLPSPRAEHACMGTTRKTTGHTHKLPPSR